MQSTGLRVCLEKSICTAIGFCAFSASSACIDESRGFACFGFLVRTQIARSRLPKHLSKSILIPKFMFLLTAKNKNFSAIIAHIDAL